MWAYVGFIGLVVLFLALDLGVFHREAHEVSMKEAATWSVIWLTCGVAFSAFVYKAYDANWLGLGLDTPRYNTHELAGQVPEQPIIISGTVEGAEAAKQYLVGYVVEKSLAMDNIFIIALIFAFFAVPAKYQHRVLFWGIIGALIMRGGMIGVGAGLILKYQWILIVFGGFLVLTALKMALIKGNDDPSQNIAVRLCRRFLPTVDFYDGQRFFTKRTIKPTYSRDPATGRETMDPPPAGSLSAKWAITPLFLALILVEITDLVFAVDSIPAIFAITPDPFIVFTSNIFAILGLRALYFCLAALIAKFRFLKPALILILAFVGVKLLLLSAPPYLDVIGLEPGKSIKIDTTMSLVIVLATLALATVLSVLFPGKPKDGAAA
jgi:tellurite resistance protein TerC